MYKLFSANLHYLTKIKTFLFTVLFSFCFAGFTVLQGGKVDAMGNLGRDLDYYYFKPLLYMGIIISIFIAMFIGTEYSDKTIHNKFIVGHTRNEVYISNLLTCFTGVFAVFLAWAVGGLMGIPYFGLWSVGMGKYFFYLFIGLLSILAITSLFVLLVQLAANKTNGVIIAILAALIMLLATSYFYNALAEPEMTFSYVTITGNNIEYGPEIANPAYIGGNLRNIYEAILLILPTGQQLLISDKNITNPFFCISCSLAIIIITTALGLLLFTKKDIK